MKRKHHAVNQLKFERNLLKAVEDEPEIIIGPGRKRFIISDTHNGDGGPEDGSADHILQMTHQVLPYYSREDYSGIYNGDIADLLETTRRRILKHEPNQVLHWQLGDMKDPYWIPGNHDLKAYKFGKEPAFQNVKFCDAIRLVDSSGKLRGIISHGFRADWWNAGGLPTFLVKCIIPAWLVLQFFGAESEPDFDPDTIGGIETDIEQVYFDTAKELELALIIGHTHRPKMIEAGKGLYVNSGSCVKEGMAFVVEIDGYEIRLVMWNETSRHVLKTKTLLPSTVA